MLRVRGWVNPRSLWRYLLQDDAEEPLALETFAGDSYTATEWPIGRAPFGSGDDAEANGIEFATPLTGYDNNVRYRLEFELTSNQLAQLQAEGQVGFFLFLRFQCFVVVVVVVV